MNRIHPCTKNLILPFIRIPWHSDHDYSRSIYFFPIDNPLFMGYLIIRSYWIQKIYPRNIHKKGGRIK